MSDITKSFSPTEDMDSKTFNQFVKLIYERSGISLGENKKALVKSRVSKRMRKLNMYSYSEYLKYVMNNSSDNEVILLLDAISTNVTSFYRESGHFECMRSLVKQWVQEGARSLRVWSSACSTGQEPYTIAIEILETIGQQRVDVKILATDLSLSVLKAGQRGEYTEESIAPIPSHVRSKYFNKKKVDSENIYVVNDLIRNMVIFRQFNLNNFPYPVRGPLDIVFCRNVMIYFENDFRDQICRQFQKLLKPNGYLFLGHSESLPKSFTEFGRVSPSIYVKQA